MIVRGRRPSKALRSALKEFDATNKKIGAEIASIRQFNGEIRDNTNALVEIARQPSLPGFWTFVGVICTIASWVLVVATARALFNQTDLLSAEVGILSSQAGNLEKQTQRLGEQIKQQRAHFRGQRRPELLTAIYGVDGGCSGESCVPAASRRQRADAVRLFVALEWWMLDNGIELAVDHWARLETANFEQLILTNADLRCVSLGGTKFDGAELVDVRFSGGNLARATFSKSHLWNVRFDDVDLSGATFTDVDFGQQEAGDGSLKRPAVFAGAILDGVDLRELTLQGIDFSGAKLEHALVTQELLDSMLGDVNTTVNETEYTRPKSWNKRGNRHERAGRIRGVLWECKRKRYREERSPYSMSEYP